MVEFSGGTDPEPLIIKLEGKRKHNTDWRDSSANKVLAMSAGGPEFDTQQPHKRDRSMLVIPVWRKGAHWVAWLAYSTSSQNAGWMAPGA